MPKLLLKLNVKRTCVTFCRSHNRIRWIGVLSLLALHLGCSSYEFGVFTRINNPAVIVANLDCNNLGDPVRLDPTLMVQVTSGSQGFGIVQLQRVILEYCTNAVVAAQSSSQTTTSPKDACEAAITPIHSIDSRSLVACKEFYKQACLASLRFPHVLTCSSPKKSEDRRASACFLGRNQTLSYQDDNVISLQSMQQTGFTTRSSQTWGKLCCEIGSQECQTNRDCGGRGTCQGHCQYNVKPCPGDKKLTDPECTPIACSRNTDCPMRPQKCLSLCDDKHQRCSKDSECPRANVRTNTPGTCKKRCTLTGESCTVDNDCPSQTQACLRYCSNTGSNCKADQNCARGESCVQACSRSHIRCQRSEDCPTGEVCQELCIPAAQVLVFVGFEGDPETGYAQQATPRRMRLFCRGQSGTIQLNTVCQTPKTAEDPPATVCAKSE